MVLQHIKRAFGQVADTVKKGITAWMNPDTRSGILSKLGQQLNTGEWRDKLVRHAQENMGAVGGLAAKAGLGLMDTIPLTKAVHEGAKKLASGDLAGAARLGMDAIKDPGSLAKIDAKEVAKGVVGAMKAKS